MIGNYYSYDIPAALKTKLDDYMGNPDDYETLFNLLYTVYSIPNIFLPFLGGFFVDKFGVRTCLVSFVSLITLGAAVRMETTYIILHTLTSCTSITYRLLHLV